MVHELDSIKVSPVFNNVNSVKAADYFMYIRLSKYIYLKLGPYRFYKFTNSVLLVFIRKVVSA